MNQILKKILLESGLFLHQNGMLNVSAVAKASGIPQPTVKRIIDGESKNPKPENVRRLCELVGADIGEIYAGLTVSTKSNQYTSDEKEVLSIYRSLSSNNRKLAIKLLLALLP